MKFKCIKCGKCCAGDTIIATIDEIEKIQEAQNISLDYYKINNKAYGVNVDNGGHCVFLKNKLCSIYEIAPVSCKIKPIAYKWFTESWKNKCDGFASDEIVFDNEIELERTLLEQKYGIIEGIIEED